MLAQKQYADKSVRFVYNQWNPGYPYNIYK